MDSTKRWAELLNTKRFRQKTDVSSSDKRDDFESDYGRLISSSPIRRLQDKTQVFPLEKSDFIRTRLTHSLEVSSIARSIGKSIEKSLTDEGKLNPNSGISNLLACSGLIHDLGNPPYGHFGETAIQNYFKNVFDGNDTRFENWSPQMKKDFQEFDGNVQTLRIILKLQFLGDEFSFNLSFPTIASIIKYPRQSDSGNNKESENIGDKKFGYFITEQSKFEEINKALNLKNERHPVTYLLEAADDIAYSGADIEDGVKLGILDYNLIITEFDSNNGLTTEQKKIVESFKSDYKNYSEMNLPGALDVAVQRFRIKSQGIMIHAIIKEFLEQHDEILNATYNKELLKCETIRPFKKSFKNLTQIVFKNKNIVEKELSGYVVIQGLLKEYINSALSGKFNKEDTGKSGRLYNLVSSSYRYIYEQEIKNNKDIDPLYLQFQLITDFIGGMTDTYALELYQRISGIR